MQTKDPNRLCTLNLKNILTLWLIGCDLYVTPILYELQASYNNKEQFVE